MNATMSDTLHHSAMLAALNISQWTARKYDKNVSKEVEAKHQATDAGRFGINIEFTPVPTSHDFRVNLNEEYVASIREDIEQRMVNRQREAMKHCWTRVREVVGKIHERLADKDNTFRDTLITNAEEL